MIRLTAETQVVRLDDSPAGNRIFILTPVMADDESGIEFILTSENVNGDPLQVRVRTGEMDTGFVDSLRISANT